VYATKFRLLRSELCDRGLRKRKKETSEWLEAGPIESQWSFVKMWIYENAHYPATEKTGGRKKVQKSRRRGW